MKRPLGFGPRHSRERTFERRIGMKRREFLATAIGTCTTLLVIEETTACSSKISGSAARSGPAGDSGVPDAGGLCTAPKATFDPSCTNATAVGGEFIFDVETHWLNAADLVNYPAYTQAFGALFTVATEDAYIKAFFCDSETTVACLNTLPGILCTPTRQIGCGFPLSNESVVLSRDKINALAGNTQRVLNHFQVLPQDPSGIVQQLAMMEAFHCEHGVAAWELHPGFAPGFRFDDADGLGEQILEKGLDLGVSRFCVYKGTPIGNFFDTTANYPDDIGPIAVKYSEANIIVGHAAFGSSLTGGAESIEGPYDATSESPLGTDALIRTVLDNGIPPGGNVYATTGKAFGKLMASPDQAAHFFGKLLRYLGPDNVLWATGSITTGVSPQQQIEAFRALVIPQSMQDQYGYPALTDEIKAKVFGLNAARLYDVDPSAVRCRLSSCPA